MLQRKLLTGCCVDRENEGRMVKTGDGEATEEGEREREIILGGDRLCYGEKIALEGDAAEVGNGEL